MTVPRWPAITAAALAHLARDRAMARLIRRAPPCALVPVRPRSLFDALLEAIVHQQLSGAAAATIHGRVKALFPRGGPTAARLLALDAAALRTAGLSRAKTLAAQDLAARVHARTLPTLRALEGMPDDEVVERLTVVRGIGRWTVEMLLIFRLGRPDVLPVADLGVRKGFQRLRRLADLPAPAELLSRGERWRPYRSFAAWYLWRACELEPPP